MHLTYSDSFRQDMKTFTARGYASAVYATALCLFVCLSVCPCLSVCHKSVKFDRVQPLRGR